MAKTEKEAGLASPEDIGSYNLIFTAKEAINAGLKTKDWKAVAEGFLMLEQAIESELIQQQYILEVEIYQGK